MNFADKASVLETSNKSLLIISHYNLAAINLSIYVYIDTNTFPPKCPHLLAPGL